MSTTNNLLLDYINGNVSVKLYNDGTKVREYEGTHSVIQPESMDVKITNYCDLGCPVCHESSTKQGKHADLTELCKVIAQLPNPVELAIGGGNPLSHPQLPEFLAACSAAGHIPNLTVNQGHLGVYFDLIKELLANNYIYGIGVSITSNNFKYIEELAKLTNNLVLHVIIGVQDFDILEQLKSYKILVLGYKDFGFGINYHEENRAAMDENMSVWLRMIHTRLNEQYISFDNLAIEQLELQRWFTKEGWGSVYQGDDGSHTMYIDAVEQTYAITSRSSIRTSWKETNLLTYFNSIKK